MYFDIHVKSMKKFILNLMYLFIVGVSIFFHSHSFCDDKWLKVKWVDDGDTIIVEDDRRIRYIGINTPEIAHNGKPAEPFGYEAMEFNRKLVQHQKVRLEYDREIYDQYGRVLGYVFLPNGVLVNNVLVLEGLAYCMPCVPSCKYDAVLLKSQQQAMLSKKGIWKQFYDEPATYIGNTRSKRFHHHTCPFGSQTGKKNRQYFKTKWDAFWAGFAPCNICIGAKK